jgi:hypothetical protein
MAVLLIPVVSMNDYREGWGSALHGAGHGLGASGPQFHRQVFLNPPASQDQRSRYLTRGPRACEGLVIACAANHLRAANTRRAQLAGQLLTPPGR